MRTPTLVTEKVEQPVRLSASEVGTEEFWIAYPVYVLAYGHVEDRIVRAWGKGWTEDEALESVDEKPEFWLARKEGRG